MKKIISFLAMLIVGVLCSACVNTLAVHELNKLAAQYLEKGDGKNAISRLESSIDLDDSIWETRYNLAVAYLKENDCNKALENIDKALKLASKENIKDTYYTKGIIYDCKADDISNINKENSEEKISKEESEKEYIKYLQYAIENYEKYLEENESARDFDDVKSQIENNKRKISEMTSDNFSEQ